MTSQQILLAAALTVIVNLPFGYWRASEHKLSGRWFFSVHAPVPLVIAVRLLSGVGLHLATIPVMAGAFFGGQFLGGRLHQIRRARGHRSVSSCLVWDIVGSLRNKQNPSS